MKKTFNINLAGLPFTIDDDAYRLLKDYLDTIRYAFDTSDDTGEIAADIESRIAEILIEKENGNRRIITRNEVTEVIERIGKPSEFIEIRETEEVFDHNADNEIKVEEVNPTPPPYNPAKPRNPFYRKKLFRDPQHAILGGVCAGLAAYFNVDVTIIRILAILLFFISGSTVAIVYIILWIVEPEAATPLQRMQMMGEDPTMENIGKTVTENFQQADNKNRPDSASNGTTGFFSTVLSIFVKCLIFLGLLIAVPLMIAFGIALIGCVIAVFVIGLVIIGGISGPDYGLFDSVVEGLMVFYILLAVVGGIITLGVPLWLFIKRFWFKKNSNPNHYNRRAVLITWLCGLALVSIFTVKAVKKGHQLDSIESNSLQKLNSELNFDDIEDININSGKVTVTTNDGKKYIVGNGKVTIEDEVSESVEVPVSPDSIQALESQVESPVENPKDSVKP